MHALNSLLGRRVGPSTGTNFAAMLQLADEMRHQGRRGSILSLICDAGERYLDTWYDAAWSQSHVGDLGVARGRVDALLRGAPN
jgi:cysteine synthase A